MRIGIPKEVKESEKRVAVVPEGVAALVTAGHEVLVESCAGSAVGFLDEHYVAAGALVSESPEMLFEHAELIVKVKEPQADEIDRLAPHHTLFTFLHLAADPAMAQRIAETGATCIAYEMVTDQTGALPLLSPMSEIAGRLATQIGAQLLLASNGGVGTLLGGIPGTPPARVAIVGGGVVGRHACAVAVGFGAQVTVLDRSRARLQGIDAIFGHTAITVLSNETTIGEAMSGADLVIGAILIPGSPAPRVIRRTHLSRLAPGAVIVDVSIDQGGCAETSTPTSFRDPVRIVDDVRHCAISNLPAAAARTATRALTSATLPYIARIAQGGTIAALEADSGLRAGLSIHEGALVSGRQSPA